MERERRLDQDEVPPTTAWEAGGLTDGAAAKLSSDLQIEREFGQGNAGAPKSDEVARKETREVLAYIKSEAAKRAAEPPSKKSIDKNGAFYQRLENYYLKDYLKQPSPETGKAAVSKISAPLKKDGPKGDWWEEQGKGWGEVTLPGGVRTLRSDLPKTVNAATDILSTANRKKLPVIDVPQMVGEPNLASGEDADVMQGGKNVSQLMHWGTGVGYSDVDPMALRELFLAYEEFHLEAWDVFGEDPINDLIAEDAGRIMGRALQAGQLNRDNLHAKLDEGWNEARAWVGTLLRARQTEFDQWILLEKAKPANYWWQKDKEKDVWGKDTIFTMLKAGHSVDDLKQWKMTERIIDMYSLIPYSTKWEEDHGEIKNSRFIEAMLAGKFDEIMAKSVKGEELTPSDKARALYYMGVR